MAIRMISLAFSLQMMIIQLASGKQFGYQTILIQINSIFPTQPPKCHSQTYFQECGETINLHGSTPPFKTLIVQNDVNTNPYFATDSKGNGKSRAKISH